MNIIIKKIIKETFSFFVFYSGILSIYRFLRKKKITILNYHDIKGEDFERHVKYLIRHFDIIPLGECVDCLNEGKEKSNSLVITFDDGYKLFYKEIFPILKKYSIPATVFIATDYVGSSKLFWFDLLKLYFEEKGVEAFKKKLENIRGDFDSVVSSLNQLGEDEKRRKIVEIIEGYEIDHENNNKAANYRILNWKEIKEMAGGLICFGAHTMSHPILTKISLDRAREEIFGSKDILERQLEVEIKFFAYPNGDVTDFDDNIIKIVKKAGFSSALTTIDGNCKIGDDLFILKRKVIDGKFSIPCLAAKIAGLWVSLTRKGI